MPRASRSSRTTGVSSERVTRTSLRSRSRGGTAAAVEMEPPKSSSKTRAAKERQSTPSPARGSRKQSPSPSPKQTRPTRGRSAVTPIEEPQKNITPTRGQTKKASPPKKEKPARGRSTSAAGRRSGRAAEKTEEIEPEEETEPQEKKGGRRSSNRRSGRAATETEKIETKEEVKEEARTPEEKKIEKVKTPPKSGGRGAVKKGGRGAKKDLEEELKDSELDEVSPKRSRSRQSPKKVEAKSPTKESPTVRPSRGRRSTTAEGEEKEEAVKASPRGRSSRTPKRSPTAVTVSPKRSSPRKVPCVESVDGGNEPEKMEAEGEKIEGEKVVEKSDIADGDVVMETEPASKIESTLPLPQSPPRKRKREAESDEEEVGSPPKKRKPSGKDEDEEVLVVASVTSEEISQKEAQGAGAGADSELAIEPEVSAKPPIPVTETEPLTPVSEAEPVSDEMMEMDFKEDESELLQQSSDEQKQVPSPVETKEPEINPDKSKPVSETNETEQVDSPCKEEPMEPEDIPEVQPLEVLPPSQLVADSASAEVKEPEIIPTRVEPLCETVPPPSMTEVTPVEAKGPEIIPVEAQPLHEPVLDQQPATSEVTEPEIVPVSVQPPCLSVPSPSAPASRTEEAKEPAIFTALPSSDSGEEPPSVEPVIVPVQAQPLFDSTPVQPSEDLPAQPRMQSCEVSSASSEEGADSTEKVDVDGSDMVSNAKSENCISSTQDVSSDLQQADEKDTHAEEFVIINKDDVPPADSQEIQAVLPKDTHQDNADQEIPVVDTNKAAMCSDIDSSSGLHGDSLNCRSSTEQSMSVTNHQDSHSNMVDSVNGDSNITQSDDILFSRQYVQNVRIDPNSIDSEKQFTIVSYNILAQCHLENDNYSHAPEEVLKQNFRHQRMVLELQYLDADIVCLQEVGDDYFNDTLEPAMKGLGYAGIFKKRVDDSVPEGCATFYRIARFSLIDSTSVAFRDAVTKDLVALTISEEQKAAIQDYIKDPSIVLLTKLKCILSGMEVTIGNIHVSYACFKHPDIQCVQIAYAINRLVTVAGGAHCPHILAGDINSEPTWSPYQLAREGYLSEEMIEKLQGMEFITTPDGKKHALINLLWKGFQHTSPNLQSAYKAVKGAEPSLTSITASHRSCLDYIFCSQGSLDIHGVMEAPTESMLTTHSRLPSVIYPSDHISMKAVLSWK